MEGEVEEDEGVLLGGQEKVGEGMEGDVDWVGRGAVSQGGAIKGEGGMKRTVSFFERVVNDGLARDHCCSSTIMEHLLSAISSGHLYHVQRIFDSSQVSSLPLSFFVHSRPSSSPPISLKDVLLLAR